MGQVQRISRNNTKVFVDVDNYTCVKLHSTIVVRFNEEKKSAVLFSGGWQTVTTKTRINQTANQYRLPFRVEQSKGIWYVWHYDKQERIKFHEGIIINW